MPSKSELTIRAEMVLEKMEGLFTLESEVLKQPFGTEEITRAELRRRYKFATTEERGLLIQMFGSDALLDALGEE